MITHIRFFFFNLQGVKYVNVSLSHNYRFDGTKICTINIKFVKFFFFLAMVKFKPHLQGWFWGSKLADFMDVKLYDWLCLIIR